MTDQAIEFFDSLTKSITSNIHTCMLGKIKTFDHKKMKAEVIPLYKHVAEDGKIEERKPLIEVPVSFMYVNGFYIRPPYKKDDLVIIIFSEEDMDKVLVSGDEEQPNSNRKHDISDAIIIGSWKLFDEELQISDENENDLVISNKENNFSIIIKEDGKIEISSKEEISINSSEKVSISGATESSTWV